MMSGIRQFSEILPPDEISHGSSVFSRPCINVNAGALSMLYENGNLRYISAGNTELIRMIYSALRGREWVTVTPAISEEKTETTDSSFKISYRASYKSGKIDFIAFYTIEGKSDNTIIFNMEGEARSSFEKNRLGFCILHPLSCAGNICSITHSDGSTDECEFPEFIAPHQPFIDITAMNYRINDIEVSIKMHGDIFETEDQRNWSDASFKTYSTPLAIPYPALIEAGTKIFQRIEIKALIQNVTNGTISDEVPDITLQLLKNPPQPLPPIGIGMSSLKEMLTPNEAEILRKLHFGHLRVELLMFDEGWRKKAARATAESKLLECPVEFVLFLDENAIRQLVGFIDFTEEEHPETSLITILHKTEQSTPDWLTDAAIPLLKQGLPEVRTSCGTNANFAQLNRSRPESLRCEFLNYSIHPQEHASDNLTLVENLQAQAFTVESAKAFARKRGIWVSPVTIQRRFNANAGNFEIIHSGNGIPMQIDPRMMSLFGACWTAGSLKYLLESGVSGLTFFETVGERGIIQGDNLTQWPDFFKSCPGMIFPVYHIFRYILNYSDHRILKSVSSSPLKADILTLISGEETKMIIMNFTSENIQVRIDGCNNIAVKGILKTTTFAQACSDPEWLATNSERIIHDNNLILEPYSVTFASGVETRNTKHETRNPKSQLPITNNQSQI